MYIYTHTAVAGGDLNRNFSMIKYPRHVLGLPNEKLFKMDTENMVNSLIISNMHNNNYYIG